MMGFGKIGKKQRPGGYTPPGRWSYAVIFRGNFGVNRENWRSKRYLKFRKLLRLYENFIFDKCCYGKQITLSL